MPHITTLDHNHAVAGGDGGIVTNDRHDGYSQYDVTSAPAAGTDAARFAAVDFAAGDARLQVVGEGGVGLWVGGASLAPVTNDAVALGTTLLGFADLHLATGGVINWANGEVTITETDANTLTVAGATTVSLGVSAAFTTGTIELGHATDTTLARSAAGVATLEGVEIVTISATQTLTAKTLTTPTISGAIVFPDNVTQTFNAGADNAGLNVGSIAGDPATPDNGDLWYDSTANELTARIGGANVALGAGGSAIDIQENASSVVAAPDKLDFKDQNVEDGGGNDAFVYQDLPFITCGRLTLTTALPVTTADVTAATTVYRALYNGDKTSLFDGTRWKKFTFTEQSIAVTNTQSTTASTASTDLTVADSSQLMRGMVIASTQVTGGQTIVSITSATVVVMSAVANSNGTSSTTFKIPAGKNVDVFEVIVGDAPVLRFGNFWTNDTTRADALGLQNGVWMNNAAINSADSNTIAAKTGKYLGTVRTTATAGQTEDSYGGASQAGGKRYLWNMYHRVRRFLGVIDTTGSWNYTTATWRQVQATSGNRIEYVCGLSLDIVIAAVRGCGRNTSAYMPFSGIGIDSTSVNSAKPYTAGADTGVNAIVAEYQGYPGIGYHAINWLEAAQTGSTGTTTFYGDFDLAIGGQSGLYVELAA